jgi:hypothetical protein
VLADILLDETDAADLRAWCAGRLSAKDRRAFGQVAPKLLLDPQTPELIRRHCLEHLMISREGVSDQDARDIAVSPHIPPAQRLQLIASLPSDESTARALVAIVLQQECGLSDRREAARLLSVRTDPAGRWFSAEIGAATGIDADCRAYCLLTAASDASATGGVVDALAEVTRDYTLSPELRPGLAARLGDVGSPAALDALESLAQIMWIDDQTRLEIAVALFRAGRVSGSAQLRGLADRKATNSEIRDLARQLLERRGSQSA